MRGYLESCRCVEAVEDLARHLEVSFAHVKQSASLVADHLAKQGIKRLSFL